MHKIYLFCFFLAVAFKAPAQNFSFIYDGQLRNYIVHLPAGYSAVNSYPLVFNFHGYTSNASQQMAYSMMNTTADQNQFIVVYPDGLNNSWNVGFGFAPYNTGVDDVGFTNALLDTLIADFSVNTNRVYSCGMSNGGYFSYRLACELEQRIAAIASVTGLMTDSTAAHCNPSRKVPVMNIHGTADPVVNYNGAAQTLGVTETIDFWRSFNGCSSDADSTAVPNTVTGDNCTAKRIHYATCQDAAKILFYKIENGGHTWPSGLIDIPAYGNTNRDFNASQEIWNFFSQFDLNGQLAVNGPDAAAYNLFPNPFTDRIFIREHSGEAVSSWELFDISGKKIRSGSVTGNAIPMEGLQPGIYVLGLKNAASYTACRIVCSY